MTEQPARAAAVQIQAHPRSPTTTDSARRGGGPEDRALYRCDCGHAFKAAVSTSVGCPRCGSEQAW